MSKFSPLAKIVAVCIALVSLASVTAVVYTHNGAATAPTAPIAPALTQSEAILTGVSKGFNMTIETKCFTEAKDEAAHIESAVALLKAHDEKKLLEGLQQLGEALEPLPTLATDCQSAASDENEKLKIAQLAKALGQLKHPMSFACHAGKDLVLNGVDIFQDVDAAIKAYDAKDYQTFGEKVADALYLLLVGKPNVVTAAATPSTPAATTPAPATPKPAPPAPAPTKPDFTQVLLGVTEGFGLPLEESCLQDIAGEIDPVQDAVAAIRKKDAKDVLKGFETLAEALKELPPKMKDCKSAVQDAEKKSEELKKALSAIKGPISLIYHLGKNIIVNGVEIFEEVHAAIAAYDAAEWKTFGENLGEALHKLLVGGATDPLPLNPKLWKPVQWNQVPKGMVESLEASAEVTFHTEYDCLESAAQDWHGFDAAILELVKAKNDKNATEALEALTMLATAVQPLPELLTQCKAAAADVQKLAAAIAKMQGHVAVTIGEDLLHNLMLNGVNVYDELLQAIRDRAAGNGEALGKDIGTIVADVFLKNAVETVVV